MNRHWTQRRPLWAQILALTVFVLLLPTIGYLLLNRFGQDLIDAEGQAVKAEAAALASALEISAVDIDQNGRAILNFERARELLVTHTFSKNQNTRVRLFNASGRMLIDSDRLIDGLLGGISSGKSQAPTGQGTFRSFVPTLSDYRIYQELGFNNDLVYAEVAAAINRETLSYGVYSDPSAGRFRVLGAADLSNVQSVLGAVLIDHDQTGIEESLRSLNQRMALLFLVAFCITILVSLVLATLIATPVTRLSNAARRLAAKEISPAGLPTFPRRRDEIGDLALSLHHMARALIERADASDAFAAEVAHELKNPLTSMRSAVETLGIIKDEDKRERLMAVLAEDADRLDRLISDISASSRLDAELARDEIGRIDLIKVAKSFMDGQALVDPAGMGGVTLDIEALQVAFVRSNEVRLVQVLQNLLSNALSFCPDPSGIYLRIFSPRNGWVRIEIADSGPGIPADKLETIFKRFFTDREGTFGKHSGLGLSIVQRIVQSAGGVIWAENREEASGAKFSVDLPFSKS